ncbi:MAG: hypothetical protein QM757_25145 [Paludibaculum sp.]
MTLLEFFDAADGGGLVLEGTYGTDDISFSLISPQLFSGSLSAPVLLGGVFAVDLADVYTYIQLDGPTGSLYAPLGATTITATPEPAGLLVAGPSLLFFYFRRRIQRASE